MMIYHFAISVCATRPISEETIKTLIETRFEVVNISAGFGSEDMTELTLAFVNRGDSATKRKVTELCQSMTKR